MWYSDPFLAIPAVFAQAALVCFAVMLISANLRAKITAIVSTVFGLCFAFISASSYFFGYLLRHSEEVDKWIGTILQ